MLVPYAGKQGEKILTKIVKKMLETVRPFTTERSSLLTFFSAKDKVQEKHSSNIIYCYQSKHDEETAYIGETRCRLGKRILEHQGWDKQSAIFINMNEKNLPPMEFSIIGRNYSNLTKEELLSPYTSRKKVWTQCSI